MGLLKSGGRLYVDLKRAGSGSEWRVRGLT